MSALRAAVLPALAIALVTIVLAVQLDHGGGRFRPLQPPGACEPREASTTDDGIEGLAEKLVLLAVADAACTLGVSREELVLQIGQQGEPTDAQVDALREGLHAAVDQLDEDGDLPPVSSLLDEALDSADLNGFLEAAVRALPDSFVDDVLPTDDVLHRAIDELDVRALLSEIDDGDALQTRVRDAVMEAVKDAIVDRVRGLL